MADYIEFKVRLKPDDELADVLIELAQRRKLNRTVVQILRRALIDDQPRPLRYKNVFKPVAPEVNARMRRQLRTGEDMGFKIYTGDDYE